MQKSFCLKFYSLLETVCVCKKKLCPQKFGNKMLLYNFCVVWNSRRTNTRSPKRIFENVLLSSCSKAKVDVRNKKRHSTACHRPECGVFQLVLEKLEGYFSFRQLVRQIYVLEEKTKKLPKQKIECVKTSCEVLKIQISIPTQKENLLNESLSIRVLSNKRETSKFVKNWPL